MRILKSTCMAIVVWLLGCQVIWASDESLKLSLELTDNRFLTGESVHLFIYLSNTGTSDARYEQFHLGGALLNVHLKNSDGKEILYQGIWAEYDRGGAQQFVLKPGEEAQQVVGLDRDFPTYLNTKLPYGSPFLSMLVPGEYHVQAEYRWGTTLLRSNELSFQVVDPPDSELAAYNALKEYFTTVFWRKTSPSHSLLLHSFIVRYASSHYRPLALFFLADVSGKTGNQKRAQELFENLIEEYPAASLAVASLRAMAGDSSQKAALYEKILRTNRNARLSRTAKYLLQKLAMSKTK